MKLRIQDNSVRVRLTRGEVASLAAGNEVQQLTEFPGSATLYSSIQSSVAATAVSASFHEAHMVVQLPLELARRWAESDEVSIRVAQTGSNMTLLVLIEKDFECLHHPEDNQDKFPNPVL